MILIKAILYFASVGYLLGCFRLAASLVHDENIPAIPGLITIFTWPYAFFDDSERSKKVQSYLTLKSL